MTPTQDKYFIPHDARWPIVLSIGLFLLFAGLSVLLNGVDLGKWVAFAGMAVVLVMTFRWFGEVIDESEGGIYNPQVDMSFRMGMGWFIFSEVMFFACFFGVLWYTRNLTLPWLGGQGNNFFTNQLIWQGFENEWPSNGPGNIGGSFLQMAAWGIPAINTAILLSSGVTLTVAHHALKDNNRMTLNIFLALTVLLGFLFIGLQAKEYIEAYQELGLPLSDGFREVLAAEGKRERRYETRHSYGLEEFGLEDTGIREQLGDLFERFQWDAADAPDAPPPAHREV